MTARDVAQIGWKARRKAFGRADRGAMRIAARQWSALNHDQAVKAGLTDDQIAYRVHTGHWRRAARKVYVVAGAPDRWEQRAMIACLAGPSGTVASHLTAAALFGLVKPPSVPHVTMRPSQRRRPLRGVARTR